MTDDELIKELETAIQGLFYMSESDYPYKIHQPVNHDELTPEAIKSHEGLPADTPVISSDVETFFKPVTKIYDGMGEVGQNLAKRSKHLAELINKNLRETKVFKFGRINMPVHIVGKTQAGKWIGISTRVVET